MDYSLITLSPNVSSSSQMFTTNGLLGNTIEEKTRRILGWTEHTAPSMTVGPLAPAAAHVNQRKADKGRKTKSASISAAAPYPYSLLANESNRGRKSSCPSLCNMNDPILRQQLTPPPSPVSNVSIVSLPRQGRTPPTILPPPPPPPPPAYHSLQTARKSVACEYYSDNSVSTPECLTILPISPVSPAAPSNLIQDGVSVMSSSSSSRISTSEVFERLRKEVPHLPKEQSKFRILVQTVANVIELETKLAHLQEQTRTLSNMLSQNGNNGAESAHTPNGGQHKLTYDQQIAVDTSLASPSSINNECVSRQSSHYPLDTNFITTDVPDDLRGIDVTAFKSMMCSPHSVSTSPVASYQNICFNPMKVKNFNSSQFINTADDGCSNYFENIINYDCESFSSLNYNGLDPLLVDTSSN